MSKSKYRPVLTALQIKHILKLAKLESPLSDASLSVISTLSVFAAKIDNAGIAPAYTLSSSKPKESLLASLGDTDTLAELEREGDIARLSKEQYWEECFDKYSTNPSSCTVEEIKAAEEHMYLNDLMSPEQEAAYERGIR